MVAGCHLVFPQTRLSFDYVTYGGAYAHVTDLICRRLERWSEQTHDAGSPTACSGGNVENVCAYAWWIRTCMPSPPFAYVLTC